MIEQTARRLGRCVACAGAWLGDDRRTMRLFVAIDDPECLVACIQHLDRADDDTAIRIGADRGQSRLSCGLLSQRRQTIKVEAVSGKGSYEICAPFTQARMQRCRALDVGFFEVVLVFASS